MAGGMGVIIFWKHRPNVKNIVELVSFSTRLCTKETATKNLDQK